MLNDKIDNYAPSIEPCAMESDRRLIDRGAAGRRLRLVRLALGFEEKKAFAERLGIQPPNYTRCENGKALLTPDQYNILFETWSIDPLYLMRGNESRMPRETLDRITEIAAQEESMI